MEACLLWLHEQSSLMPGTEGKLSNMRSAKPWMAAINLVGGPAVLGSYVYELAKHPGQADALWGSIPKPVIPYYSSWMLVATAGYLMFSYFWFFKADADRTRIAGRYDLGLVNLLYVAILLPSALWMPLTFSYLAAPSSFGWWVVRIDLFGVAAGAIGMIWALAKVEPREPARLHRFAILGACGFAVQTVLLDALVWPAFFLP